MLLFSVVFNKDISFPNKRAFLLYHVGNSHTWNFSPKTGFREIAIAENIKIDNGWHIDCSASLDYTWSHPEATCIEPNYFGKLKTALSTWPLDFITIQPYIGTQGYKEKTATKEIIDYLLAYRNIDSVTVFLYCTWPMNTSTRLNDFDYTQAWLKSYTNENDPVIMSRDFFNDLVENMRKSFPRAKIGYIPVGEVLNSFHISAQKGLIQGYSGAGDLYEDQWHLNNVGRYIASLTVFCRVFNRNPIDINDFVGFTPTKTLDKVISKEQKVIFRKIISQILDSIN